MPASVLDKLKRSCRPRAEAQDNRNGICARFEEEANKIGGVDYLLQGTIYADVIESGHNGAAVIRVITMLADSPKTSASKAWLSLLECCSRTRCASLAKS